MAKLMNGRMLESRMRLLSALKVVGNSLLSQRKSVPRLHLHPHPYLRLMSAK